MVCQQLCRLQIDVKGETNMMRKPFFALAVLLLLLAFGVLTASGQGDSAGEAGQVPIITTATNTVGVGTYVAAEAYAVPAGEDVAAQPVQAFILPYGITPDMAVTTLADFVQPEPAVEGFTFDWALEAPEGSAAELTPGTVAIFMADVEGQYVLSLTATDADGNSGATTWTVYATTYVGVGVMAGGEPDVTQCAFCHADQTDAWLSTAHASFFTRGINGEVSDSYGPAALHSSTTGFDNRPEAENNGFDDVARAQGWSFPETLDPGNWDAMVAEYPEVAALANIQCESCHGPGSLHVNRAEMGGDPMIGLGLNYGTCAQCHAADPHHAIPQQWELSAHADKTAEAFWYPIGEDHAACVACHSGVGFIDAAMGLPPEERRVDYQVITCAVCHDPHDAEHPGQLRIFDAVVLPDGTDVSDAGAAATCMTCHNARTDPVTAVEGERFSTPHYSTAAELMAGTGAYTWGEALPSGTHDFIIEQSCVGCHMAETAGMDGSGADMAGQGTVGGHTFAMVSPVDGTEDVAVCQACHEGVESFAFEASGDYDGDGAVETGPEEVDGLIELLGSALTDAGVEILAHYPYFNLPENAGTDIKGAVYNYKFAASGGASAHNFVYVVSALQLSYEKLTGEPVPNADLMFQAMPQ